jgi:hypothetical protein
MNTFDRTVSSWLSVVDNNEYLSATLSLFLILYAGLAAPKLPEGVARLFDNPLFKLLLFFLIVYSAKKNPTVAIIAAVGLMVSLHTLTRFKVNRQLEEVVNAEDATMIPAENGSNGVNEGMEDVAMFEESAASVELPEEALVELQPPQHTGCARQANFRNSFYPQYVNMKPDSYESRYTGNDIAGYDSMAAYSSI